MSSPRRQVPWWAALAVCLLVDGLSADAPTPEPLAQREWTILVFLNGDNNLDPNAVEDINEMEAVGSTPKVAVVVQLDREGRSGSWRYLIKKDSDREEIGSPVLETMPEQDMGSPETFKTFLEWGLDKYPARKVAVILWNHGSGWEKARAGLVRGISYDDESGNHLSIAQVAMVLSQVATRRRGRKIDILAYDACLMQMAEVAAQVKDSVRYHLASEETEPADGYPYEEWLADVVANPTWDAAAVGRSLVERYKASYSGGSQGNDTTTQSLLDLSQLDTFHARLDAFTAAALEDPAALPKIAKAITASQNYHDYNHRDLLDFADQLTSRVTTSRLRQAADALRACVAGTRAEGPLVLASAHTGTRVARSRGLAIWLPTRLTASSSLLSHYRTLWFARNTTWDEFLLAVGAAPREIARAIASDTDPGVLDGVAAAFRTSEDLAAIVAEQARRPGSAPLRELRRAVQGRMFLQQ